ASLRVLLSGGGSMLSISALYDATTASVRYGSTASGGTGAGCMSAVAIASPSAAESPTGTSAPNRPPSRISRGPLGQSVETTGSPTARHSTSTVGSPSQPDERANRAA